MAKIGSSVLSSKASFIMITFCRLDGADDFEHLVGGPSGGNGEDDIETAVGLEIEDPLVLPRLEFCPELTDKGLECDVDPDE